MENKQNIQDLIQKFYPYAKETLGFEHPVRVIMRQDAENAQQSMGKTAYYDPTEKLIVLYVTDRHPKDVLRSFSHELVHHAQNCRGELDDLATDDHYAEDGKGREIEKEAYLQGNLNVRDYEDNIKFKGVKEMKMTKSQLKGLIEQTIGKITEGGGKPDFLDLDKDGDKKAMDEDKEPFPSFAEWFKANRKKYATTSIARKMYSAKKIAHEKGAHNKDDKKMDEQEALTISPEGAVELPEDVQRLLDMLDSQLQSMEQDDKEMIAKLITRLALEKALQTASPEVEKTASPEVEIEEQEVVTPRSEEEREEESEQKKSFKMKHPEFSKALDSVRLRPRGEETAGDEETAEDEETAVPSGIKVKENNDTWYNSSLYESLKSKWTK